MQRKWIVLAATAVMASMLAGCGERQGDLGNRNIRDYSVKYDMNGNRIVDKRFADDQMNEMNRHDGHRLNSNNIIGNHKNYRLEMSGDMADRIAKLEGIDRAYVMLTDNNAYVAVSLKDGKAAQRDQATAKSADGRTTRSYMRPMNKAVPNAGTQQHVHAKAQNDSAATNELKDRIGKEVRKLAPQIDHVYVSANPDFVDRMTSYMDDVRLGHPIQGFVAEFNAMVERIFPARAK